MTFIAQFCLVYYINVALKPQNGYVIQVLYLGLTQYTKC